MLYTTLLTRVKVHWRYYNQELVPEFHDLINSLELMSKAWRGSLYDSPATDLAGSYAAHLQSLLEDCKHSSLPLITNFGGLLPPTSLPAFASVSSPAATTSPEHYDHLQMQPSSRRMSRSQHLGTRFTSQNQIGYPGQSPPREGADGRLLADRNSPSQLSSRIGQNPTGGNLNNSQNFSPQLNPHENWNDINDGLAQMSHILLGQQFSDMDRIITLDGTDFALDMGSWDGYS